MAVVSLCYGVFLSWAGPQIIPAATAEFLKACCFGLMFVIPNIGLTSMGLFAVTTITIKCLCAYYVPAEALGLAQSLFFATGLISLGAVSCMLGSILEHFPGRTGATIALCFEISLGLVSASLLLTLWCCYRNPKPSKDTEYLLNSTEKDAEEK